jgi:hypothetical protein
MMTGCCDQDSQRVDALLLECTWLDSSTLLLLLLFVVVVIFVVIAVDIITILASSLSPPHRLPPHYFTRINSPPLPLSVDSI